MLKSVHSYLESMYVTKIERNQILFKSVEYIILCFKIPFNRLRLAFAEGCCHMTPLPTLNIVLGKNQYFTHGTDLLIVQAQVGLLTEDNGNNLL